jgi:hypothetical protein
MNTRSAKAGLAQQSKPSRGGCHTLLRLSKGAVFDFEFLYLHCFNHLAKPSRRLIPKRRLAARELARRVLGGESAVSSAFTTEPTVVPVRA